MGQATLTALGLMLALFVAMSWLLADLGRGTAVADPSTAALQIIGQRLPWLLTPLSLVAAIALGVGCVVTCHAAVSRLLFAVAREGNLPAVLGRVDSNRQVPVPAVIAMGIIITAVSVAAMSNIDLFAGLVSFGALTGFVFVNAAVIVHFGLRGRSRRWLRHWLLPALAIFVLLYIVSGLQPLAVEVGLAWLAVGVLWQVGVWLISRRRLACGSLQG